MSGGLKNLAEHSAQKKHVQVFLVYTSQQALIRVEALPSLAASGIKLNPSGPVSLLYTKFGKNQSQIVRIN